MSQNLIPWPFVPTPVKPGESVIKPISLQHEGSLGSIFGTNPDAPAESSSGNLSSGFLQALAFIIVSVGLVLLAGPFPTLVNGVLMLVLSGVVLEHVLTRTPSGQVIPGPVEIFIQTLTKWLQGNG